MQMKILNVSFDGTAKRVFGRKQNVSGWECGQSSTIIDLISGKITPCGNKMTLFLIAARSIPLFL
jgi:hypothetical protein